MLQLIFGLPLSGKTTHILKKVSALSSEGEKSIIIVPEQASFETEKAVFNFLGDSFCQNVEVLSFSRLYDEVCRKTGGVAAKTLNDSDKIIFMNKALKQVSGELILWKKYTKSLTFAQKMLDAIGEFKINGIRCEQLKEAAKLTEYETLKNKLTDLSLIYETYDLLISERYIDPADKLTFLYRKLENYRFFDGKNVFFDGFKGFTGQQYKIISRVFSQAENTYFAFNNDITKQREYDIFANIRAAVSKIESLALNHHVKISEPVFLNDGNYESLSLSSLEQLIRNDSCEGDCADSVTICKAKTIYDEAEFAARTIRKLIRNKGYRFKDFAIITRDNEKYHQAVEYSCKKNKVECFFDKKVSMLSFPLSIAALSAIKALNFSTENLLRFHKSGINILTTEEVSELENYAYIWNIDGGLWLENWDMDVRGFVTNETNEAVEKALERLNSLRLRAIEPILFLKENFGKSAYSMSSAIVKMLEKFKADESLKTLCNSFQDDVYSSDVLKQSYDTFMKVIDGIVNCYGDASITTSEYYDALYLALSLESVGMIPQTLDQVVFGQADRIRTSGVKVVFVLGANQGVFPKFCENNSIFAINERKNLIKLDIEIEDNEIFTAIDEKYLVYCNLCSASQRLYLSYSSSTLKGESLEPSSFVTAIENNLNPQICFEPNNALSLSNLPETFDAAYSELCKSVYNNEDFNTLCDAIIVNDDKKVSALLKVVNDEKKTLSKTNALELYGNNLNLSASKIEMFHKCKFSHFCKYGLRLKKLQPADFDVLQRGTIVHYVLENVIGEYKENIKDLSFDELDNLCDEYIDKYLNSVKGYRSVQTARHDFLISKISRSLKEVLRHLKEEFSQSDFKPEHCELEIGNNSDILLSFPFDEGIVNLEGKIDRVDSYDGYLRVIDYKTGAKSFKLPDILFGLNLQMLIYLYAVTRGQNLPDKSAAGIFYMHSKRDLNSEGMAMDGLAKADIDLVKAMDKNNEGKYVPKLKINKDGTVSKSSASFIEEAEFTQIFDHIEKLIANTGSSLLNGEIEISPIDGRESTACGYCDFKGICGIEEKEIFKVPALKNSDVFDYLAKEKSDGI